MGLKYLVDTNVIIDLLGNKLPDNAVDILAQTDSIKLSAVSKVEILGWYNAPKEQIDNLRAAIETIEILPIDNAVIEQTIQIRNQYKIKLGDALIAATAICFDLDLLTRNIKDFKNIKGVSCFDPYQL